MRGSGIAGFGKTWVLSHYANYLCTTRPELRVSICAQTTGDVRKTLFRGVSGILKTAHPDRKPIYTPSTREATYRNGSIITTFSSELTDGPAGTAADVLLFDEIFLYANAQDVYDEFMFTLREGDNQQIVITSTPRANSLAKELINGNDEEVTLITGSTFENTSTSEKFQRRVKKRYAGTRLGRQELSGELLLDSPHALFDYETIQKNSVSTNFYKTIRHQVERTVIAVDPSTTNNKSSDLCGISVCTVIDDHAYVIADLSLKGSPDEWAKVVCEAYEFYGCDMACAEVNAGGDMVELVLRQHDPNINLKKIHARFGKYTRAEPVSAAVSRGQISFVMEEKNYEKIDGLDLLIEECITWSPKIGKNQKSPDRMDAFVYAITELLIKPQSKPFSFTT